ncbi:hypothetical protein D1AOALGA4SA_5629 [Olavius algarvensis Delta 1 endosymbiont]|nr:hypothetical protein D1AOALGA4SA_5629 [Olavius algarvensis Delta 1 endosymbiont]
MSAIDIFREIIRMNKEGRRTGIYSVCSAQGVVLKAAMMQAKADNSILLVESTSNQVNQDCGYTGMTPGEFVGFIGDREALFALAEIERELYENIPDRRSYFRQRLDEIMVDDPVHWENYYFETVGEKKLKRKFSYLDRSRYYWTDKGLQGIKENLYGNLRKAGIPLVLISQYMPNQYYQVRQGQFKNR